MQTEIEIYFEKMKELSEELLRTAENLKRTADAAGMEIISETKAAWISASADAFVGKEVRLFERIMGTAVNLSEISAEIYDKARLIYEAEQRNVLTAKARSYS